MISIPTTAEADTVTMTGTATGKNLAGTYADTVSDSGTWTAAPASPLSPLSQVSSALAERSTQL